MKPTHYCLICGALWSLNAALSPEEHQEKHCSNQNCPLLQESWSLISSSCGKCCDNVPMENQIESLKDATKEQLIDMVIEMSNTIHEKTKDTKWYIEVKDPEFFTKEHGMYWLEGDCIAQCLNCIRAGYENGYSCKCGNPQWTMSSDSIRKAGGKI
jgi:hypothetical protein